MSKNQHVVPHKDGWAVKGEGADRASSTHRTQSEAIVSQLAQKVRLLRLTLSALRQASLKLLVRTASMKSPGGIPSSM